MGDAAHPTLPFLAQGANLALEDAWVLSESLKSGTLAEGLETQQSRRKSRTARVVDAASANARNYHLKFPPVRWVAHTGLRMIGALAPNKMLNRFDWLYREDVTRG